MESENLIPIERFCSLYSIRHEFVSELAELGMVQLVYSGNSAFVPPDEVASLEKMIRFHVDLEVNAEGIEVIQHLLQRIEALQEEVRRLKNRLPLPDDHFLA